MRKSQEQLCDTNIDKQQHQLAGLSASLKSSQVAKLKEPLLFDPPHLARTCKSGGKPEALCESIQNFPKRRSNQHISTIERGLVISSKGEEDEEERVNGDIEDNSANQNTKFGPKLDISRAIISKEEETIESSDISVRHQARFLSTELTHNNHDNIVTFGNFINSTNSFILIVLSSLLLLIMISLFAQEQNSYSLPHPLQSERRQQQQQQQQQHREYSPQINITLLEENHDALMRQSQRQQHNSYSPPDFESVNLKRYNSTNDAFILAARCGHQSQQACHLELTPDTCFNRVIKLKEGAKLGGSIVGTASAAKNNLNCQLSELYQHSKPSPDLPHQSLEEYGTKPEEVEDREQVQRVKQQQRCYHHKFKNHYCYLYNKSCRYRCCRHQKWLSGLNKNNSKSNVCNKPLETPQQEVARNSPPVPAKSFSSAPCHCELRENGLKHSNGRSLSQQNLTLNFWPCLNQSNDLPLREEVFEISKETRDEIPTSAIKVTIKMATPPPKLTVRYVEVASLTNNDKVTGGHFRSSFLLFAKAEHANLDASRTTTPNRAISFLRKQRVASSMLEMAKSKPKAVAVTKIATASTNNKNRLIVRHHRRRRHTRHANNLSMIGRSAPNKSRYLILLGLSEQHSISGEGYVRILAKGSGDKQDVMISEQLAKPSAFYKHQPYLNLIQDHQNLAEPILDGNSTSIENKVIDSNGTVNNDNKNSGNDDYSKQANNAEASATTKSVLNSTLSEANSNNTSGVLVMKDGVNITTISGGKNNTNSSEETNQCEEPGRVKDLISSLFLTIAFAFFYFIIFIIGFLGNTLTLLAMIRKREKISTMDIFISNLACSDIMLCIVAVVMTPIYLLYHKYWNFGSFMCKAVAFAQGASVYISTLTLISIAYVRYQLIVHPLGIPMKFCTAILLNCLIWVISFSINVPYLMHMNLLPEKCTIKFCVESWEGDNDRFMFSLITITVQFFLPFFLVSFFYSSISRKLREQKELRDNQHQSERQKCHQRQEENHQQPNNQTNERQQQEKNSFGRRKVLEFANNRLNKKRMSLSSDMMKIKTVHLGNDCAKMLVSKVSKKLIHQGKERQQQEVEMSNCEVTNTGSSKITGSADIENVQASEKKQGECCSSLSSGQKSLSNCGPKQNMTTTTNSEKVVANEEGANEIETSLKGNQAIKKLLQKSLTGSEISNDIEVTYGRAQQNDREQVEKVLQDDQDKKRPDNSESGSEAFAQDTNGKIALPQISIETGSEINFADKPTQVEGLNACDASINRNCLIQTTSQKVAQPEQQEQEASLVSNDTLATSQKATTVIRMRTSESLIELSTSIYKESDNFPGENVCDTPMTPETDTIVLRTSNGLTDTSSFGTCSCSNLPADSTKETSSPNNVTLSTNDKTNDHRVLSERNRRSMRHHLLQTLQQTFSLKHKNPSTSSKRDNTNGCCSTTFTLDKSAKSRSKSKLKLKQQQQHQIPMVSKYNEQRRRRSAEQVSHLGSSTQLDLRQEQSCVVADSTVKSTNYLGQPTSIIPSSSKQQQQQQQQQKFRSKKASTGKYLMNATNADILALKEQRQRERDERLRQTNRKLLWMVVMFVVAWLPLNLFNLIQDYSETVSNSPYTNHVFLVVHLFASSSVCYNPILYAWMSDNYRQELRDILPVFILKHFTCLLGGA